MIFPANAAATLITTGVVPPEYLTGAPGQTVTAGSGMVDHNSKIPYSEQANLEIDREIGHGLAVSAGYLFVAAHHLVRAENLNVCPPMALRQAPLFRRLLRELRGALREPPRTYRRVGRREKRITTTRR